MFKKLALEPSFARSILFKGQSTQLRIFKPSYEHFSDSTEFHNQSLKQIGLGANQTDKQTSKQTEITNLYLYLYFACLPVCQFISNKRQNG